MTSVRDDTIARRGAGRRVAAAVFLRKPFYPADIDAVLHRIYGLRASAEGVIKQTIPGAFGLLPRHPTSENSPSADAHREAIGKIAPRASSP